MNIQPGTKLYLLQGVPITNNYKDTLYFANPTDQYNYFYSKRVQTYSDFTYQRVESNKVRVALGAESCYTVNYMMFKNETFGTRWFYAFVTNAEYINNECTEITYEIDKIQTWWFDLTIKPCFVKRQHNPTDNLYENCEAEEFTLESKYVNWEQPCEAGNTFVTITNGHWDDTANNGSGDWVPATGNVINNIVTNIEVRYFKNTTQGIADMHWYLFPIIDNGHEEDIIAIYCASAFVGASPNSGVTYYDNYGANKSTLRTGAFQGYTPKNNKLYNYPFCKLIARSPTNTQEYAIEDFRSGTGTTNIDTCNFRLFAVTVPSPALLLVPKNYRGESLNYEAGLDITDFPFVPFRGDTFKMWTTQNAAGYGINIAGQAASMLFGGPIGAYISLRGAIESAANLAAQTVNWSNKPDNTYGLQKGNIFSNMEIMGFRLQCQTIDYWQARQVDNYFTMYGYAQNIIMTPNVHARSKWTYIQTADCTLVGNAPSDDISFIESCFNKGITWWVNASEVGNYDLTNAVLT